MKEPTIDGTPFSAAPVNDLRLVLTGEDDRAFLWFTPEGPFDDIDVHRRYAAILLRERGQ